MIRDSLELVFFRDGGTRFAVDQEQVRSIHASSEGFGEDLIHFQKALGSEGRPGPEGIPKVFSLKTDPPSWVLVDEVESILQIPFSDLRPLPPLAEARIKNKGLWAVALVKGELVLLADFQRISGRNSLSHHPSQP